jgi:hypothetical protein
MAGFDSVFVAKVEGEKNMVVIEQIDNCVYTMCALRKDLRLKDARTLAKSGIVPIARSQERPDDSRMEMGDEWWRGLIAGPPRNGLETCSVPLQFLISDTTSTRSEELFAVAEETDTVAFVRHDSEFSADSGYISSPQDPSTLAKSNLISQYLEALYSTKTSLAYFAKSALSRARAEFQRVEYLAQGLSLISFLQTMVLSMDEFNTKYENFLPTLINDTPKEPTLTISEEERRHLIQKLKREGGREEEINEKTLQREINELKNREYKVNCQSTLTQNTITDHHSCRASRSLRRSQRRGAS